MIDGLSLEPLAIQRPHITRGRKDFEKLCLRTEKTMRAAMRAMYDAYTARVVLRALQRITRYDTYP